MNLFDGQLPSQTRNLLVVEALEQRQMLSTVDVMAWGTTGEEVLVVTLNDDVVSETQMLPLAESSVITFEVPDNANPIDLKLEFRNDLYLPDQGIDRNLVIESFEFNGEDLFGDGDNIYSTGTWLDVDGISPGFGRGNVLHANGYMQYDPESRTIVGFDGLSWQTSVPYTDETILEDAGDLLISGVNGAISVSRQAEFDPGSLTKLTAEAFREFLGGQIGQTGPWATVGVNFYDFNGNFINQRTIEFNGDTLDTGPVLKEREFVSPDAATAAYLWAWIDGFEPGTDIPLRLSQLKLETVDLSSDQVAPVALIAGTGVYTSARGNQLDFGIVFQDETRLNSTDIQGGAIRVVGPNGIDQTPPVATGFNITETSVTLLYILETPDGRPFDSSFNGTYEVFLVDNRFKDAAGNFAPGGLIGTIELAF